MEFPSTQNMFEVNLLDGKIFVQEIENEENTFRLSVTIMPEKGVQQTIECYFPIDEARKYFTSELTVEGVRNLIANINEFEEN